MKCDEEDLKYCYMLLAGAGAIVAGAVFCLTVYWDGGIDSLLQIPMF